MTISGSVVGRETVAYFKQANTWGTASGGGDGILLVEDGMEFGQALDPVEENNSPWLQDYDLGQKTAGFNFKQAMRFDDIRGIAMVLGDGNYDAVVEENTGKGDYRHHIWPGADNFGDFATMAIKKGSIVQTLPSVKFAGFTLSGQSSPNRAEISFNTFANDLTNASTVITASSFDSLSIPSGPAGRCYFRDFYFEINDQSAATLDYSATYEIANAVTSFEFSAQRQLASDYTNSSGLEIEEPVEDGYLESTLTLQLRNLDGIVDGFYNDWINKTKKKLRFRFTGPAASSATGAVSDARVQIDAPCVYVENVDYGAYSGPGRISGSVTFRLVGAETTADATGMNWVEPFRFKAINNQSSAQVS